MKFNLKEMAKAVFSQARVAILKKVNENTWNRFQKAKAAMLEEIRNHAVSQELNKGSLNPSSSFVSGSGNLFSFLGFLLEYSPVDELIKFINDNVKYVPASDITVTNLLGVAKPVAEIPSKSEFVAGLPLFWEPGISWVFAIENGVSNIGNYLFVYSNASRSGKGIQAKKAVGLSSFRPVPYITPILNNFKSKISGRPTRT